MFRHLPLALLVTVLLPRVAAAQPEPPVAAALGEGAPLSLRAAVARAVRHAPALRATEAEVAAARAEEDVARLGFFPGLQLEGSYTRIGGFDDGTIQGPTGGIAIDIPRNRTRLRAEVQASLTDPFVRVLPTVRALEAQSRATGEASEATRLSVALRATVAYLDYADARAEAAVVAVSERRVVEQLERLRALAAAGLASEVQVLDVEAHLAEVESRSVTAAARVRVSAEALASAMGEPAQRWAVDLPSSASNEPVAALVERALAGRPELRAMRASLDALDTTASATRGGRWPSLGTYAAFEVSNPNPNVVPPEDRFQRSWELGVFARWSPNAFARANREVRRTDARATALREQLEARRDEVRLEVRRAAVHLEASGAGLAAARAQQAAARRAYEAHAAELAAGRVASTDLLRAEEVLAAAELSVWRARSAVALAEARLRAAVGDRLGE